MRFKALVLVGGILDTLLGLKMNTEGLVKNLDAFKTFPKPQHNRRVQKRKERSRFTSKTVEGIFQRDEYRCIRCGVTSPLESVPHHVIFRSRGGTGHKRNGVTVCLECHRLAHLKDTVRRWFEQWVERNLDEDGNMKDGLGNYWQDY